MKRAKAEADVIRADAAKQAETARTNWAADAQNRKQFAEAEAAKIMQNAKAEAAQERMRAKKDADLILTEGQKQVFRDYDEARLKIEAQINEAQERSSQILSEAETKASEELEAAKESASRTRVQAAEEARALHAATAKATAESFKEAQERLQKEMQEQKKILLERAHAAGERERERILAESATEIDSLKERLAKLGTELAEQGSELAKRKAETDHFAGEVVKSKAEIEKNQKELEEARKLISEISALEARKVKEQADFDQLATRTKNEKAKIEAEWKALRDQKVVELDERRRELDNDIAKMRVKAMDDIKKDVEREQERFDKAKRLRAMEISQRIAGSLLPVIPALAKDSDTAPAKIKTAIESAVQVCLVDTEGTIETVAHSPGPSIEEIAKARRSSRAMVAMVVVFVGIIAYIERHDLRTFFNKQQTTSYASEILEKRREEGVYRPTQTDEYHMSYVDNVLYMRGYYEAKTDPNYIQKWTLKLNDLTLLRSMGLNEEDIVHYISKEVNLVKKLGEIRKTIDAVYLNEGLSQMRDAELESLAELKATVKTEANFKKIHDLEHEMLMTQRPPATKASF
jgi:hypothetical protein